MVPTVWPAESKLPGDLFNYPHPRPTELEFGEGGREQKKEPLFLKGSLGFLNLQILRQTSLRSAAKGVWWPREGNIIYSEMGRVSRAESSRVSQKHGGRGRLG